MQRMTWILLALMVTPAIGQDGRLESIRSEVRDSTSSPSEKKNSKCDDSLFDFSGCDFNPFSFLEHLFCFQHNPDNYEPANFVAYPYADGWPGLMQIGMERNKKDGVVPSTWEHLMSIRASLEEGNNFDGINRLGLVFLVDTMTHLGLGGSIHWYEESVAGRQTDQLAIGDFNLYWRHFQSITTQSRFGLGARFLSDKVQTDWGFNMVYALDWFPAQPVTIGMQLEAGTLGNAWVFRATGRMGLAWKYSEIYAGYDNMHIGSQVLQGPMVGLRVWF